MRARRRKPDTAKEDLKPPQGSCGGQGAHREVGSEGHAEKYRAVVEGATPGRTGRPKVGQGRACTMEAKAFSSTHRTKVCADGTAGKISA